MSDKILFHCRVCGAECDTHPIKQLPNGEEEAVQAICENCCEDHDFEYLREMRGWYCKHCDMKMPNDY